MSGIANQLRDIYSICKCCWNVATYKCLEYRINWERYTPYAGAAGMLLHINVWNIESTERYILHMQVRLECWLATYKCLEYRINWEIYIILHMQVLLECWLATYKCLEYRINWEIYTPYASAAGMLLHINVWNIDSTERYILHMQVLLECCYI
jgi:hypothetical protein